MKCKMKKWRMKNANRPFAEQRLILNFPFSISGLNAGAMPLRLSGLPHLNLLRLANNPDLDC